MTTVWLYWEGDDKPHIIDTCIRSVFRHHSTARLLGPDDVRAMGGGHILEVTTGKPTFRRADLLRFWLLSEFGGVWLDTDILAIRQLDFMDEVDAFDFIGVNNASMSKTGTRIMGHIMAGRKGSLFFKHCYQACLELMQLPEVPYEATSIGVMHGAFSAKAGEAKLFDHWRYSRVPWNRCESFTRARSTGQHEECNDWGPNVCTYHLTNKLINWMSSWSGQRLLNSRTFLSFLIQKSLGAGPAVPGRTRALCSHLSKTEPLIGVEIGVFDASNARNLLQQRRDVTLYGVDPYQVLDDYPDGKAKLRQSEWDQIQTKAISRMAFAGDRFKLVRKMSHSAWEDLPEQLDFGFIDGNHTREYVDCDISNLNARLKPGGLFAGHDYRNPWHPGVTLAVDAFAKRLGVPVLTGEDMTWFIRKPKL